MIPLMVDRQSSGMVDVLARDLGVSRALAQDLIDSDERFREDVRPVRLAGVRRLAGALLIGAGRLVGGRPLAEAGSGA